MAQPKKKTVEQLESELQAAKKAAEQLEKELAEAQKAEADKKARQEAIAKRQAKKKYIRRKAELDTFLVDYEDVTGPRLATSASTPAPVATRPATPAATSSTPAPVATRPATPAATSSTPVATRPASTPTSTRSASTPALAPVAKRSFMDGLKKSLGDFVDGFRS